MDVCLPSNPCNPNPIPDPNLFHDSDITRHSNVRQAMAEDLNEGFTMWPARQVRGASPLPSSSPSSSSSSSLPSACLTAAGRRSLAG